MHVSTAERPSGLIVRMGGASVVMIAGGTRRSSAVGADLTGATECSSPNPGSASTWGVAVGEGRQLLEVDAMAGVPTGHAAEARPGHLCGDAAQPIVGGVFEIEAIAAP